MSNQEEQLKKNNSTAQQLPPDLQLLYDSLSKKIDEKIEPVESKLSSLIGSEFNLPKHIEDVNEIKIQHKNLERKLVTVERENESLKQRLTNLEDKILEHNIVVSGIEEGQWEEDEQRVNKINCELAKLFTVETQDEAVKGITKLDIMSTERLGRYNPARPRPIAVRFVHKKDVDIVLSNKKRLGEGIFVDRQYSDETENERRRLRPILTAARKYQEYRGRCKMEGTDLIIRGKKYSWNNLHDLPQNISTHSVSSRQDSNHYGFFGELNPLSNFHPAPFKCNGIAYSCSEQYIQACKASFSGDTNVMEQIMQASTPLACKNLGKTIKNCDLKKWNKEASEVCYPGLLEKFKQNPGLCAFLKNTGNKTILECCYDDVWGNGIPLTNPKCIDPDSYKQQGILGEMLERIRQEVRLLENSTSIKPDRPQAMQSINGNNIKESISSDMDTFPVQT